MKYYKNFINLSRNFVSKLISSFNKIFKSQFKFLSHIQSNKIINLEASSISKKCNTMTDSDLQREKGIKSIEDIKNEYKIIECILPKEIIHFKDDHKTRIETIYNMRVVKSSKTHK